VWTGPVTATWHHGQACVRGGRLRGSRLLTLGMPWTWDMRAEAQRRHGGLLGYGTHRGKWQGNGKAEFRGWALACSGGAVRPARLGLGCHGASRMRHARPR
jgi:hypothetical protein